MTIVLRRQHPLRSNWYVDSQMPRLCCIPNLLLLQHLSKWTAASDLPVIHHFLTSLVKETPRIMDYVLLHLNNSTLLKPICQILDAWNSSDEYGAGQAMELYGGILLATKTFIHRHALQKTVSNFNFGTASALVASSSVSGSAYPLQALSPEDRKLVSSWITALFGSEGIEDDLIRATAPRTMLLLAPTIVHQSVTAMENGIIDQESECFR